MNAPFQLSIDSRGIGKLVFDLQGQKVNKLSPEVLENLGKILDEVAQNKDIQALIIISGKSDVFIAGADLQVFGPAFEHPERIQSLIKIGHQTFRKLAALPFPTIAVINGVCLGGGLELALACTYRMVSDNPKTQLGLPEVNLGIFPGWGGTQRLPRLVGLSEGLQMILSGRPVKALKAWKIHLADAIYATEFQDQKVAEFVKLCITPNGREQILKKRNRPVLRTFLLEGNPIGRYITFKLARRQLLQKTKGHYPAPLAALDLIEKTYTLPLDEGLKQEERYFIECVPPGPFVHAKNLISLFFVQEALKKDPGVPITAAPEIINSAAVLGAGTMGGAIAYLISFNDIPVRLKDINWEAIGKGYATANSLYTKLVKEKKLKPSEANLKFHHLSSTLDYTGFHNVDLTIEAVVENLALKKQIFAELEENIRPNSIIASNTSSLTIAEMSSEAKHPERFVGMHFFNPPNRMPLVEIVPGPKTTPQTLATAVNFCRKLGKTPIIVGDCHGFLVNRIFALGANEVIWMFEEGVPMDTLAKMMLDFGMPMDPFRLADDVGNDVTYKVTKVFEDAYGPRMSPPPLLKEMYDHKLYGKKTGKGFYIYSGDKAKPNPEVINLRKSLGTIIPEQDMIDRVMFVMINEAARCLQEKIITKPEYLDMALIMGIGFPPFRGGLLRYADEVGLDRILAQLDKFSKHYGPRFEASPLLVEMHKNKQTFYKKSI